jgi:hypothetical protein
MAEEAMEKSAVDSTRREDQNPKRSTALDLTILGVTLAILAYCSWCADRPHAFMHRFRGTTPCDCGRSAAQHCNLPLLTSIVTRSDFC